jgi:hypothetical protein
VRSKISLHAIIVDERVVDVEQEDNSGRFDHRTLVYSLNAVFSASVSSR